jgi:murein DD-endopeptidase MepM/ murein hydrolase activator NlpD
MKKTILVLMFSIFIFLSAGPCAAERNISISSPGKAQIGQPFLVTASCSFDIENLKISWQGKECTLNEKGRSFSALIGTDLKNAKDGMNMLVVSYFADGKSFEEKRKILLVKHEYPRENLKVSDDKLNPPACLTERIKREAKMGREAIQTNTPGSAPLLPLLQPVSGRYTSVYGKSRYFNGEFRGRHGGVDIKASIGTPVKAAASGKVVLVGNFWFAGNCIYIDHGAGLISFYGHMSKISKIKGENVQRGDVIGLSGKSGRVTGPHLHFSVSWRGEFFDPAPIME